MIQNLISEAVSDGMNDLQHIPESQYGPVLVTLNPPFQPKEDTIQGRYRYEHPVLDAKASSPHVYIPIIHPNLNPMTGPPIPT